MLELKGDPLNKEAWERFLELGCPTREWEVFRYVRLKKLYSQIFTLPGLSAASSSSAQKALVFVNGRFSQELSILPSSLEVLSLTEALKRYAHFLKPRLEKQLKEETNPFALLNRAYCGEGVFLYAPPQTVCEEVIPVINLIDSSEGQALFSPRLHFFGGKNSSLKFSWEQAFGQEAVWVNSYLDFALEEGARVHFEISTAPSAHTHHMLTVRATLKQRSILNTLSATTGGATSREDYKIDLLGQECSAALNGVWDVSGDKQHHVHVWMHHHAPSCQSLQKFKGILFDHARSSFEGKIYVEREAQQTQAYQLNPNLLLSEHASANSKPNLEIFADDVKASHGATVGQLDEEALFYLKSRGISLEKARRLLIQGFKEEILDQFLLPRPRAFYS